MKKKQTDKARQKTDKHLKQMERDMSRVYRTDPALIAIKQKYDDYMSMVEKRSHSLFLAYQNETDMETRKEAKRAYQSELEALTVHSREYQRIVREFVSVLARVNQKALNIANSKMQDIYVDNYNQVATDCEKAGIKVDGETEERQQ